jgi:hypothetical protein
VLCAGYVGGQPQAGTVTPILWQLLPWISDPPVRLVNRREHPGRVCVLVLG